MSSDAAAAGSRKINGRVPVIVVDDSDRPNALQIENILKPYGYTVHLGQPASVPAGDGPDLIVLDFDSRQKGGHPAAVLEGAVPTIYLTGSADAETVRTIFAAGGRDYLLKPVRSCEVLARVNAALDRRRMEHVLSLNQRLQAVVGEARMACHELNQPLQFILGSIQLMLMDLAASGAADQKMRTMAERSEQMGVITGRLNRILRSGDLV